MNGDLIESTGCGSAEIEIDAIDVGGQDEPIDLEPIREQRRREILVDHRLDAGEALSLSHDGNAAATQRDDDGIGVDERANDRSLDDLERLG